MEQTEINVLAEELKQRPPQAILGDALERFGSDCAISFSGAEDVVLIDMASRITSDFRVFMLDTGRLHPETYRLVDAVRERYGVTVEVFFPEPSAVQRLVTEKGMFSFYRDGHGECCGIRKVEPLRRALSGLRAWITGQRRDQSPTRGDVQPVELDATFSTAERALVKYNPLFDWSSRQVWDTIRAWDVPYNALHERGFVSIGCEPCTRPVLPGQHEREGRWWWEESTHKECGLHIGNIGSDEEQP